jgi:phosphatidylserine decarboxylase
MIARALFGAGCGWVLAQRPEFRIGGMIVGSVGIGFAAFAAYFFRDPERPRPEDPGLIYSPGDGRVLSVDQEGQGEEYTVRIFLSIFDVHVQRAPCAGTVESVTHESGGFLPAMAHDAMHNQRCVMRLKPDHGARALVVQQLTGLVARRIECWVAAGAALQAGERYGLIRFGSQVAVTVPVTARVLVTPGDVVSAGVTPIAEWKK